MLKLSLIIPVYNEERHIKACLDAVAAQTVMPDEVIVVDNNCTDNTVEIVKRYNFVTVITEKNQGRGHARSAGFNAAKHEILGRIDADSRIENDWIERVKKRFTENSELAGITGLGKTVFIPGINSLKSKIYSRNYFWFVHAGFNTLTMWGANMAISKNAWSRVKDQVVLDDKKVHEDQDISLWIASNGGRIIQDNRLLISIVGQSYRYLPKLLGYYRLYLKTKKLHTENGNLTSPNLSKLGFFNTLPGRLLAIVPGIYLILFSVVLFPIDFAIKSINKNSSWLD